MTIEETIKALEKLTQRVEALEKLQGIKPTNEQSRLKFNVGDSVYGLNGSWMGQIIEYDSILKEYIIDDGCEFYRRKQNEIQLKPAEKPQFVFTEDEKIILKNLNQFYCYIARDKNGTLCVYHNAPCKDQRGEYWIANADFYDLPYEHLFKGIKWNDEPCEFRKYIGKGDE